MSSLWTKVNRNIPEILKRYRHIAVVGLSNKTHRPSYQVSDYMKANGYTIYPVNPNCDEVLGIKCVGSLKEIEQKIEIVDIFRRSEEVLPIVEEAIAINARVIWMQLGVINEDAAQMALDAGLDVVMDRCIKIEYGANY